LKKNFLLSNHNLLDGALPGSLHHLVYKADVTPSPKYQAATGAV